MRDLPFFSHFVLYAWEIDTFFHKAVYKFPVRNTKRLKNDKLCRDILLFAFYNTSQRNFGILLILWCFFLFQIQIFFLIKSPCERSLFTCINTFSISKPTFLRSVETKVQPVPKCLQIQSYHKPKTQYDWSKT